MSRFQILRPWSTLCNLLHAVDEGSGSGTCDAVRSQTHRPGVEPRDRERDAPPCRSPRRRPVEDRRLGGPGGFVVRWAVRCAGSDHAAARVSAECQSTRASGIPRLAWALAASALIGACGIAPALRDIGMA